MAKSPRHLYENRRKGGIPLLAAVLVLVSAMLALLPWKGAKVAAVVLAMSASALGIAGHLRDARRRARHRSSVPAPASSVDGRSVSNP
jgi:hypothetical protein